MLLALELGVLQSQNYSFGTGRSVRTSSKRWRRVADAVGYIGGWWRVAVRASPLEQHLPF